MPVTARLSQKLYEKLGDEITRFNKVDATYRSELRELNELNFGRFDVKLGGLESRVDALDTRLTERMAALDGRMTERMGALESRLHARMAGFEARIIKWMFLFWIGQAVTTVGLVFAVVRLTGR